MASKLKSTKEFKDAMEAVFTLLSEDPEMGPRLRDADVPQRFDFDDVELVLNARATRDGERDQGEADAVAAVLGLEVGGAVPDAAHRSPGHVRDPHPRVAHGAERERQAPAAGLGRRLGGRLAGRRLALRGPGRPGCRRARRGTARGPLGSGGRGGARALAAGRT